MNTSNANAAPPDDLDRLFSDFFKSQLKRPWPNAPFSSAVAHPSELAVPHQAETPRNQPASANRDTASRARVTLAASVAFMLGTCWYLSNGHPPGERPSVAPNGPTGLGLFKDSDAKGTKGGVLDTLNENKAKGNGGATIDIGKLE